MKFQPKRFVVEVKRGTSRASFSSPDAGHDKFSNAEATLFGSPRQSDTAPSQTKAKVFDEPPRRILESLIEEPPAPDVADEPVEAPRRGRKPGSKNKPKLITPAVETAPAPSSRPLSPDVQAFLARTAPNGLSPRAPSPFERNAVRPEASALAEPQRAADPGRTRASDDDSSGEAGQSRRQRLRDRSTILKRYVLGTEPKLGQTGSLRARRKARAAG